MFYWLCLKENRPVMRQGGKPERFLVAAGDDANERNPVGNIVLQADGAGGAVNRDRGIALGEERLKDTVAGDLVGRVDLRVPDTVETVTGYQLGRAGLVHRIGGAKDVRVDGERAFARAEDGAAIRPDVGQPGLVDLLRQ